MLLFAEIAREIGNPVAKELQRASLPMPLGDRPESYLPVRQAMRFIRSVERREGIGDLGLLVARKVPTRRVGGSLRSAQSLPNMQSMTGGNLDGNDDNSQY